MEFCKNHQEDPLFFINSISRHFYGRGCYMYVISSHFHSSPPNFSFVLMILLPFAVGGMSRPPKPAATAKKVPPPAVPHEFRHSGSSFGSAGYASSEDAGFLAPADPPGVPRGECIQCQLEGGYKWIFLSRHELLRCASEFFTFIAVVLTP